MDINLHMERIINIIMNSKFLRNFSNKMDLLKPIETIPVKDNWQSKEIVEKPHKTSNEPLIALNSYNSKTGEFVQLHNRIFPVPAYFKQNIENAMPIVYSREGVVDLLLKIIEELPDEYGIIVYDGYRPISVQQSLYDVQYKVEENKPENKNCSPKELEDKTKVFVSIPSKDPSKPSTHNTGGAIDFSICDLKGNELNFGCRFDDFRDISSVDYFEKKYKNNEELTDSELEAMLNRRILSNIGKKVGFALYELEWWHMDAYDQWDINHSISIYGSCDLNGIIPNPKNNISKYIHTNKKLKNHIKYLTLEANKQ